MPLRPATLLTISALTVTALLAASCASGPGDDAVLAGDAGQERADPGPGEDTDIGEGSTGADPGETGDAAGQQRPSTGELAWEPCGAGDECAELAVPLDHDDPAGETIELSITRVPASGDRIGALFVNPGGPGGTASDFASNLAFALPGEITEQFDIVGVDPRGTGASAIDCGADFTELYGIDPTLETETEADELVDANAEYAEDCEEAAGDVLPHLGTRDVARDLDAVRAAMGDEQLSYLGFSYGTSIGQVYADMFPDRVRAMVLDGVVEIGSTGVEAAEDQAVGFEGALTAFAEWCDSGSSCPIAPDARAAVDDLVEEVESEPIPASPRDLGPGELALGLAMPLYDRSYWPDLAESVSEALEGDGSGMVDLADQYLGIGGFDVYYAVSCLDSEWPDGAEAHLEAAEDAADEAPLFGEAIVNDYLPCSTWPAEADPLTPVTASGAPPILVVSTTNDPATPYQAGVDVAERLESGVLLTYEGDGHTVTAGGVPCVDDAVSAYLVDLEPPEDGTTC